MTTRPQVFSDPETAMNVLADRLAVVSIERGVADFTNRILAMPIAADRDSPAADVSAMDGYAVCLRDLQTHDAIGVSGECVPGSPPSPMIAGYVQRIFTGAVVPPETEAIVKREDTEELRESGAAASIRFRDSALSTRLGENIRRAGENAVAGSVLYQPGQRLHAAAAAMLANFGYDCCEVFSRVRVAIITTGNEVGQFADALPQPWQLRNSNRTALLSLLAPQPCIHVTHVEHCADDRQSMTSLLRQRLLDCDAILMTGGVSMGDYDHVPDCCRDVGGDVVFHGLPLRPGKPILGAVTGSGQLILGLPGNPISATLTCRRFGLPLLAKCSGATDWNPPAATVVLDEFGSKTLPLHWLRLVRMVAPGQVVLVPSQGSGDVVSLAHSDGFIHCPPGADHAGPWPYFGW